LLISGNCLRRRIFGHLPRAVRAIGQELVEPFHLVGRFEPSLVAGGI